MCRCSPIWRWCLQLESTCLRKWSRGSRTSPSFWDRPMLIDRIPGHRVEQHKPTPRVIVSAESWRMLTAELAAGRTTLFGLWGDAGRVHMALLEQGEIVVVTIECRDGEFPSVGQAHPPAIRLEQRLGYVHKGIESLMAGTSIEKASRLAGRTSGDSTIAYALAFANAVEAAAEVQVPARAVFLRALMAELERLANHFGDIGAICNDASFVLMHAQTGILRERCLRAADVCFGHRLMMDRIVPGGLARDIAPEGQTHLRGLIAEIRKVFPHLVELYDK